MRTDPLPPVAGLAGRLYLSERKVADDAPVLLFLHGGPGFASANRDEHFFDALLKGTEAAACAAFDQRGCGDSLAPRDFLRRWHLEEHIRDLCAVVEWIKHRFARAPRLLVAHSWGTIIALRFLSDHPGLVHGYLAISQVVCGLEGEMHSYHVALRAAHGAGRRGVRHLLVRLSSPPHRGIMNLAYLLLQRSVIAEEMRRRGVESLVFAPPVDAKRSVWRRIKYALGYAVSVYKLWPQCLAVDFEHSATTVDVPCVFLCGRHDPITPSYLVGRYFLGLRCPVKRLVLSPCAGHRPHLTDPGALREATASLAALCRRRIADGKRRRR